MFRRGIKIKHYTLDVWFKLASVHKESVKKKTKRRACIQVCMSLHLRSHSPFSCVALPSDDTRASLKLTSQESSDSSPDERQRGGWKNTNISERKASSDTDRCHSLTCLSVVKLFFAVHREQSSGHRPRKAASFPASQTTWTRADSLTTGKETGCIG